jgi:threonine/homoserine/homoserine lactone efflux protein
MMPAPYTQLILVNVLLAVLIATTLLGAPIFASMLGACGAGTLLYVRSPAGRSWCERRRAQKSAPPKRPTAMRLDLRSGRTRKPHTLGFHPME